MKNIGTQSIGIKAPLIKEGDDIVQIVVESVLNATWIAPPSGTLWLSMKNHYDLNDKDIIGITESVVARSQGNYVTIDEIASDIKEKYGIDATIDVIEPIYSRNRFAMILKGIARGAKKVRILMPPVDEVGNVIHNHPFTKMNYDDYYKEICGNENCDVEIYSNPNYLEHKKNLNLLICSLHHTKEEVLSELSLYIDGPTSYIDCLHGAIKNCYSLIDICNNKCEYGVLGSNKATEEKLKLFPRKKDLIVNGNLIKGSDTIVKEIKEKIKEITGLDVIVCVYADGCYKDPSGIWEFADPVSMVSYTDEEIMESTPNEIKVKYFIDNKYGNLSGENLENAIRQEIENNKNKNLIGEMSSQGTTPRKYKDLLASLFDLTSGSGSKCTPIILCQSYFQ